LTRALRGFAHGEIKRRYLGFLMTTLLTLDGERASGVTLEAQSQGAIDHAFSERDPCYGMEEETWEPGCSIFVGLTHPPIKRSRQ
jgi:hypothetical protein